MDIKIKKEESNDRKLDIPNFKSSSEINKELDKVKFKEHNISPKDTMKFEKHEDDLDLSTQFITTEFSTEDFETLEVNTIDLEQDIKTIEAEYIEPVKKHDEDTIKIGQADEVEVEHPSKPKAKRQFKINIKYLYLAISLLVLIVLITGAIAAYRYTTSDERFVEQALENPYPISDINVYGESVNITSSNSLEKVDIYNPETEEYTSQKLGKSIDDQIHFSSLADGNYYLFNNNKIITMDTNPDISYQTITRDGQNKDVTITTDENNIVNVDIKTASKQQIDVLIDPSQGLIQGFTASDDKTTEQELSLKYAEALQKELEAIGYNVKLTRTDDSVPGDCDYQNTYCEDGRVAMAYQDNPKLYIQLAFNGSSGSGFEITDSTHNSHTLARILKSSLSPLLSPSERVSGQLEPGIYNNTYDDENGNKVDYLYLIRETGGVLMGSDNTDASQYNTQKVGAEAITIDLGYISEATDFEQLNDQAEIDAIAKAIAGAIDQYVNKY